MKSSVFEDDVVAFKEEDTPVEFSRTTSLSSLTIDDEPKISNDAVLKVCLFFFIQNYIQWEVMDSASVL